MTMIKCMVPIAVAGFVAFVNVMGFAHADQSTDQDNRDLKALASMKVTLPQAIKTAEEQVGGQAVSADISQKGGTTSIAVEVAGASGVKTVLVNAQTGQVTGTADPEHDEDNEEGED